MPDFLVFTLSASLASFGDVAGHERRGSWTWPGRSAILGLMAAAQGIRREGDFAALDALRLAVASFGVGVPLRDYHTVQTVPTTAARRPQSRPEALRAAGRGVNPTITLRDYRADMVFGVAVSGEGLAALARALERPVFHLYLGRKACPLNAPLDPRILAAPDPAAALGAVRLPPWWPEADRTARILHSDPGMFGPDRPATQIQTRHDAPLDRRKWHFAPRAVETRGIEITAQVAS
ncbi:MAG: type I-E CRISPR-associated protein Cas5/CasD [Paracoccaceae bacterium]|nr:MAG: type I-E CRISPR-associated protein Cas5/CasD [Paracoccaceae bacterium]